MKLCYIHVCYNTLQISLLLLLLLSFLVKFRNETQQTKNYYLFKRIVENDSLILYTLVLNTSGRKVEITFTFIFFIKCYKLLLKSFLYN